MKRARETNLPTLYIKTATGALQYWSVAVDQNILHTRYGLVGGKEQTTSDTIAGKSFGKSNQTSPCEQALKEARAKWTKQKKKGYVESKEMAEKGQVDSALIKGGVEPMLAHKFAEQGAKIKYPCFAQPKLDGIRCIAVIEDGVCTLWSRTRKPIRSVPHIVADLQNLFKEGTITLDGELYNHALKSNFEKIVSAVRKDQPSPESALVQYHVYDVVNTQTFKERHDFLQSCPLLTNVETREIASELQLVEAFDFFRGQGYEGAMARNAHGLYEHGRSFHLQKLKEFEDAEFDIVAVEEGHGKLQKHVAAFVCRTAHGQTFKAKMSGSTEKLKEFFDNQDLWFGKKLTVKYQGLTGKNGVPRFPVGLAVRNYE